MRIVQVRKTRCDTEWLSLPGGGSDAVAGTRSAALLALWEADTPRASPLKLALAKEPKGWSTRSEWHAKNADRFIVSSGLGARVNQDANLSDVWRRIEAARTPSAGLQLAWKHGHRYALEIVVADPRWLAHLRAGDEFETTAYDVWREDGTSAPPTPSGKAVVESATWTAKSRAKVHGSKSPHPLDPAAPTADKDWKTVIGALKDIKVSGKGAKTAERALEGSAQLTALDPEVERYRLLLISPKALAPLVRTWWRVGGPAFVWRVLAGTTAPIDVTQITKGGRSIESGVKFKLAEHLQSPLGGSWIDPKDEGLFATLRRLTFTLATSEWGSFREAGNALLGKHGDAAQLVYALGRDKKLAPAFRGTPKGDGDAPILASFHDPKLALEYVEARCPNLLGAYAFDVVELLGERAAEVLQVFVDRDRDRYDKDAREALAIARGLAPTTSR